MQDAATRLSSNGELTSLPNVTEKATKLLELIKNLQRNNGERTRIIIFTEQTVLAFPVAHLVQQVSRCKVATCTGVGSMTDGQRNKALQSFRSGEAPVLTCTAALEEGLDVSECEVVIRFSAFKTTKSHIQGAGRARKWGAQVYYFDNDPHREIEGAELMERTAKSSELSISGQEMLERRAHKDVAGVHPYRTSSGAEISVFNGVQLVYEYAARTMGQSFRPEEIMLNKKKEVVCEFPPIYRSKLVAVKVPSPEGFFDVHAREVDALWGELDLEDVAEKARMKNWDGDKKELRRFLYVVAVELSKRGFLDRHNEPSARAMRETRHACEAFQMTPGVRVGVMYDPRGLREVDGSFSPSTHVDVEQAAQLALGASDTVVASPTTNCKGRLNELTNGGVMYTTTDEGGRFCSVARLPDGRTFAGPTAVATKKAAEQLAAESALAALAPEAKSRAAVPKAVVAPVASSVAAPALTMPIAASSTAAPLVFPPRVAAQTGPASSGQEWLDGAQPNFKGRLNEVTRGLASYNTVPAAGGFLATVMLPDGSRVEAPRVASSKKEAEQLAAEAALGGGGRGGGGRAEDESSEVGVIDTAQVLAALQQAEVVALADLVRKLGVPKSLVNRHLYDLQQSGLARKVVESPAVWSIVR